MKRVGLLLGLLLVLCAAGTQAAGEQNTTFIIVLADQPVQELAESVGAPYRAYLAQLQEQVRAVMIANRPAEVLSDLEEGRVLAAGERSRVEQERLTELNAAADLTLDKLRQAVLAAAEPLWGQSQAPVLEVVSTAGGQVLYQYRLINGLAVSMNSQQAALLEARPEVAAVIQDQQIESHLNFSIPAIGAGTWWATDDGGIWDVAVLDSGLDRYHPAFSGHTVIEDYFLASAMTFANPTPIWDTNPDDVNGHGTHVSGIISSGDAVYKGVAYGHDLLFNLKAGFDRDGLVRGPAGMYWSDAMAAVDWSLSNPAAPDVFNLSYGGCASAGDYGFNRFWDAVVDDQFVGVTVSAGNDGFSCIHYPSTAYNVLSVANVDDKDSFLRSDHDINTSSSRGPAPDGRRKPDIAAPGTSIISANNLYDEGGGNWLSYTGTSQAAPHMAGALLLALDGGLIDPRAQKALFINTAEDRGAAGWDAAWGWGYLNLQQAYYHRSDLFEDTLSASPDYHLYKGPFLTGDTITLVWNRHVNYSGASYPPSSHSLNDLDLYLYNEANNVLHDTAISAIDNVEQVQASADFAGVIRVQSSSLTLQGVSEEEYALATEENFAKADGPLISVASQRVFFLEPGELATVTLTVNNSGDLRLFATQVTLDIPVGVNLIQGTTPVALGNLAAGDGDSVTWVFQKGTAGVILTVNVIMSGEGYGLDFAREAQIHLVNPPDVFMPLISK